MTQANKGKFAEGKVQAWLEAYAAKNQAFDWERGYDAHTAGGRMQRMVGDFTWFMPGKHGVIEVKEVGHAFRLPHDRLSQKGKLRIRQMAGGTIIVIVYHTAAKLWRPCRLEELLHYDDQGASWDLQRFQTYSDLNEAMSTSRVFPR